MQEINVLSNKLFIKHFCRWVCFGVSSSLDSAAYCVSFLRHAVHFEGHFATVGFSKAPLEGEFGYSMLKLWKVGAAFVVGIEIWLGMTSSALRPRRLVPDIWCGAWAAINTSGSLGVYLALIHAVIDFTSFSYYGSLTAAIVFSSVAWRKWNLMQNAADSLGPIH